MRLNNISTAALIWVSSILATAPLLISGQTVYCSRGGCNVQFSPGVTFKSQEVQCKCGDGDLGACDSIEAPDITGGTFSIQGISQGMCHGALFQGGVAMRLLWNNGETSRLGNAAFRAYATTTSISGEVTDGKFKGCRLEMSGSAYDTLESLAEKCSGSGMPELAMAIDELTIDC